MTVADSYKNYEYDETKAFDKGGKPYVKATCKCDRCGGTGIYAVGVENGHIKPHPAYDGVCLKCNGSGIETKEVRLYTEEEYARVKVSNEKAKVKAKEKLEAKMKAEYEQNRIEWLSQNNFSEDGFTYIITGDSYSIKDELKAAGFKFSPVLKWHRASAEGYEDKVIKIFVDDVISFSAWGKGVFNIDAQEYVDNKLREAMPPSSSEWVGNPKEKLVNIECTIKSIIGFDTQYGHSNLFTFDYNGNILTWFTATYQPYSVGDVILLTGTIKEHTEYKNVKQTQLTRCKINKKGE